MRDDLRYGQGVNSRPAVEVSSSASEAYRRIKFRVGIVGYSRSEQKANTLTFGWILRPEAFSAGHSFTPAKRPLSAVVRIPAWWRKLSIDVTTRWEGQEGKGNET